MIGGSNKLISTAELARFLDLPPRTVAEHCRSWGLTPIKIGKHLRFRERDVALWLERRSNGNGGDA